VDRFAAEGLKLSNYNVESQCTPSRAALMTGRYSVRTGCTTALPGAGLVAWEVTIADKLKELGYSTACYGKWHMGEDVGRLPTDKGFDYWYGLNGTWDVADTSYNYEEGGQSWVLYKVFMPIARELQLSLQKDSVPFGAPLDFNPYRK
jgi:arylsulfatase A-like enzyme